MSTPRESRPTWAEVDLDQFDRNLDVIAGLLPEGARLVAVLKADGGGHGAIELARRLTPDRVAMIALALLEEALDLRQARIMLPTLGMGPLTIDQNPIALDNHITICAAGPEELEAICVLAP